MITLSAPLRGAIGADLKLGTFSDFVYAHRPGEHGTAIVFDESGTLLAHPDYAKFVDHAQTHHGNPQLPNIGDLGDQLIAEILNGLCSRRPPSSAKAASFRRTVRSSI